MICLTLFFDDPFWVGHLERLRDGRLEVARVVFGAEPSNAEILEFIQGPAWRFPTSPPVGQAASPLPIANPKRRQRAVARQANRVAALCFGPESVLVIAGMNKVMGDLDSAIARARQVAAPANAQRFDIKTPCAVTGSCGDCTSPDCICCQMVITRACRPAGRIKVILVGEDLGF